MQEIQTHLQRKDTLTKSELISAYLQQMALPSMFNRQLSESDYELWDTALEIYSRQAIKFALDNWITSGRKFPLPSDIIPLCISFQEQEEQAKTESYKHKRGQRLPDGWPGILAMWSVVSQRVGKAQRDGVPYEPMTDEEINQLASDARNGAIRPEMLPEERHFLNGNAVWSKELVQARALATIGLR